MENTEKYRRYVSINDNCIGCGRCMLECPAAETNISVYNGMQRKLAVNPMNCISCGGCFSVCSHDAREFLDDTDSFFEALKNGEAVSVIVSTDFYMTYGNRAANILGYLRSLGVNKIYDSGFGADIFVYLNARYEKEYVGEPDKRPFIMNACPAVTAYIQRYEPAALDYIIPVQTPPICTAIYARKYLGDNSKFAFISSCITRKPEFDEPSSGGNVDFSVTFAHLMKRIGDVDLSSYNSESDLSSPGFGSIISASGGLREYVASLFSEEEIIVSYKKLDERNRALISSVKDKNIPRPFIVSIAGCEYGCATGAGADVSVHKNYRTYLGSLQNLRRVSMIKKHRYPSYWDLYRALEESLADIVPEDFETSLSDKFIQLHTVPENIINDTFNRMHMVREDSRHIDCRACGYNTCREMASAVAKGYARIEDCTRYVTDEFKRKLFFDDMTGIPSSQGFHMEAGVLLRNNPDKKYVICAGNVNGIKTINDLYNFNIGSQVIVYVARMLSSIVSGRGIAARLGGNNFVMCFEHTEENLRRLMAIRYFDCGEMGIDMPVTMRFGLCEVNGMLDLPRITNYASLAMEKNTDRSRNAFKWYDEDMRNEISVEAAITSQMRRAMYNNEFTMYLQPQYNHSTGELVGAESLCRWIKPDGSIISPGVFIPIFEKSGFIKKLDKFMWKSAFTQIKKWQDEGTSPVPISVNISRLSLEDDEIISVIDNLQSIYDIDQHLLHFEITESAYTHDQEALISRITKIREMGFLIAMDDFGSGYSSLNTLKDIPIDILKLDMGFLRGDSNTEKGGSIIGSVIRMAHMLGLVTVAEGVETMEQADFLKSLGCDVIQGYLYARPMPVDKYEDILKSGKTVVMKNDSGDDIKNVFRIFDRDSSDMQFFEKYMGPAAMFDYDAGKLSIIRVNDLMIDMLGYKGVTAVEFSRTFDSGIPDEDRPAIVGMIKRALEGEKGVVCMFGYLRPDSKKVVIRARLWCIGRNGDNPVIYATADDVTDVFSYGKV